MQQYFPEQTHHLHQASQPLYGYHLQQKQFPPIPIHSPIANVVNPPIINIASPLLEKHAASLCLSNITLDIFLIVQTLVINAASVNIILFLEQNITTHQIFPVRSISPMKVRQSFQKK